MEKSTKANKLKPSSWWPNTVPSGCPLAGRKRNYNRLFFRLSMIQLCFPNLVLWFFLSNILLNVFDINDMHNHSSIVGMVKDIFICIENIEYWMRDKNCGRRSFLFVMQCKCCSITKIVSNFIVSYLVLKTLHY